MNIIRFAVFSKSDTVDFIHNLNCTTFSTDLLPVLNGKKAETNTEDFLQEVFDILMEYIKKSNDRNNKILDFHQPEQILETMDFSLPDKPQNLDQILVDCKDALKYQVKTGKFRIQSTMEYLTYIVGKINFLYSILSEDIILDNMDLEP